MLKETDLEEIANMKNKWLLGLKISNGERGKYFQGKERMNRKSPFWRFFFGMGECLWN